MRSDVPVGACLSGGLDSSAIAALIEVPAGEPMQCFSLRYEGSRQDESHFASAAAAARGDRLALTWVEPTGDDMARKPWRASSGITTGRCGCGDA